MPIHAWRAARTQTSVTPVKLFALCLSALSQSAVDGRRHDNPFAGVRRQVACFLFPVVQKAAALKVVNLSAEFATDGARCLRDEDWRRGKRRRNRTNVDMNCIYVAVACNIYLFI